jgi:hypothetical protein
MSKMGYCKRMTVNNKCITCTMIITTLMTKRFICLPPSKNLNELHINFFLTFVSESTVQQYYFIKDLKARNVE